jgi:MSHA pilin protein MshD
MSTRDALKLPANLAPNCSQLGKVPQRGISLIELIMFIIIVGIGVAGILLVFNVTTKASADPLIHKQMLAIAEALMEEVQAKPFTYCDPDDAIAPTAASEAACTTAEAIGPEGETRFSAITPFDNVNDYGATLSISPITDITGTAIGGLGAYSATIAVAGSALGGFAAADSLLITVTVTGPGNDSLALQGYRARYAPNAVP